MLQVAEYRSNKEEARKARVAEEQADLDAMHRKEAEEEVCCRHSACHHTCMLCAAAVGEIRSSMLITKHHPKSGVVQLSNQLLQSLHFNCNTTSTC